MKKVKKKNRTKLFESYYKAQIHLYNSLCKQGLNRHFPLCNVLYSSSKLHDDHFLFILFTKEKNDIYPY